MCVDHFLKGFLVYVFCIFTMETDPIIEHCLRILPEWTGHKIEITPITTGLTNQNYRAECRGNSVFVRVFGPADFHLNRENELMWRSLAAEDGLCPRIIGGFENGWIEEFVVGRTWTVADLRENVGLLAELVSKLHAFCPPGPPVLYDRLAAWHRLAASHPLCPPLAEIEGLTAYLQSVNSPVVFCHNDLQEGNLMETETGLLAVDFEFSGLNPRGFDLANLFCEMAIDNQVAEYPGFTADFSKYPSRAFRDLFYRVYGDPDLEREVDAFELASHLQWALWGIVQANASNLKFGFIEYAEQRLAEYYKKKADLVF